MIAPKSENPLFETQEELEKAIAEMENSLPYRARQAWLKFWEAVGLVLIKIGEWLRYGDQ